MTRKRGHMVGVIGLVAVLGLAGTAGISSQTTPATAAPRPVTSVFKGSVAGGGVAASHVVQATGSGPMGARLQWASPGASVRLTLARANAAGGWTVVASATGPKPVVLSYNRGAAGRWRLQVVPVSGTAAYTLGVKYPGAVSPSPPFLTLLFSRMAVDAADRCVKDNTNVLRLDADVAPALASRGLLPTGTVQTKTTQEGSRFCGHWGLSLFASWADLQMMRDGFGWALVSHSRHRADYLPTMTPQKQWDETCGSLLDLRAHGHIRGGGFFAYPNNRQNDGLQADFAGQCFAFGRRYGAGMTTRTAGVAPPYWQSTGQFIGGRCNDTSLPCAHVAPGRYTSPDSMINRLRALRNDQWFTLQAYLLVEGSRPGLWDCTAPNWEAHWTTDAERYCWNDYQRVLSAIPANVVVTDPQTVADAWRRAAATSPTSGPTTPSTAGTGTASGTVASQYSLTVLPAPAGARWAVAEDIDEDGNVTGAAQLSDGRVHALVWRSGTMTDLTPAVNGSAVAYHVNSGGTIAGFVHTGATSRPYVWSGSTATELALPAGTTTGHASGAGIGGAVVGDAFDGSRYRAVVWRSGTPSILPGLGGSNSFAARMSATGDVIGSAQTATGRLHAVMWAAGTPTDLGTLGGADSLAFAVNAAGAIVGQADTPTATHAVLWRGGAPVDLGALTGDTISLALDIDTAGFVVGESSGHEVSRVESGYSGVAWDSNGIQVLGPRVTNLGGASIVSGVGVNDGGVIAVTVIAGDGSTRAGFLTPTT
ncbi:MAG: hypothetical protein QOF68_1501 [Gaiellales bacterium]|nr:hypothetical protein [Gaiellales bacterium]